MSITRRTFMKASGMVAAAPALLSTSTLNLWAQSTLNLGDGQIDILSDGNLVLPLNFILPDVPHADVQDFFRAHKLPLDQITPDCNVSLFRNGSKKILFDVGSGANFMPSAGKLLEALEILEVDPSEITDVVFTHGHPDHLWGLEDDFGDLLFSEAQYHMSIPEFEYWNSPDTLNTIGASRQVFAAGAKRNLELIGEKISLFKFEQEILPGVKALNTVGHTPGHTSFEISNGNESVVVLGDAITNQLYSFERPEWPSGSDQDAQAGIATRTKLLDQVSHDKMKIIGFHFAFPGIGYAEKFNGAYKFVAA